MQKLSAATAPESATAPVIRVDSVSRTYVEGTAEPQPVLRGVSLEIAAGEFVALTGASGSGKTTLLNLIGGIDCPDQGRIEVAGYDLHGMNEAERSAFRLRRFGFVFQFFNLLPHLTVCENIALPLLFLNRGQREAFAAARALADETGLGDKFDRRMHQLSGGEMQRVALARALVHRPLVLLADEPTGNLDSDNGRIILELIRRLGEEHGATVLMVTHDSAAAACADRIVHMRDGRITEP